MTKQEKSAFKLLVELKHSVDDAIAAQYHGHTDRWKNVQDILDKIDDEFDIDAF